MLLCERSNRSTIITFTRINRISVLLMFLYLLPATEVTGFHPIIKKTSHDTQMSKSKYCILQWWCENNHTNQEVREEVVWGEGTGDLSGKECDLSTIKDVTHQSQRRLAEHTLKDQCVLSQTHLVGPPNGGGGRGARGRAANRQALTQHENDVSYCRLLLTLKVKQPE